MNVLLRALARVNRGIDKQSAPVTRMSAIKGIVRSRIIFLEISKLYVRKYLPPTS